MTMAKVYNKYSMRRESLISPWGVGSIVPFPHDESLMVAGINYWFDDEHRYEDSFIITDERLSRRLGGKQFIWPPDFREKSQDKEHAEMKIPAVRFPLWHYCPVCGNMEKLGCSGDKAHCKGDVRKESQRGKYCEKNRIQPKKLPLLVPERFIAVCEDGHIEDFPIMEWVHKKSDKTISDSCKLTRSTGGSSSALSGIRYTCTCGASANMGGAFGKAALDRIDYHCSGKMPWLGDSVVPSCGKSLIVLQRGASNIWFADIISSVYIPWLPKYKNQNTKECIAKGVKRFCSARTDGKIDEESIRKFVYKSQEIDEDIDMQEAISEIVATLNNALEQNEIAQNENEYRKQEFDVLTSSVGKPEDELYCINNPISKYRGLPYIKSISLVHKLRETRVFRGFRRIVPDSPSRVRISANDVFWLPAVKNSGEGIMFEFDIIELRSWASRSKVKTRVEIIEQNLRNSDKITNEEINPIYILLHTFAHCLITTLANECGYSNASIREKIYCEKYISKNNINMAGVLIYTASGDSEGSLGGLVRQGLPNRIENIIKQAINEARWCAADPVCIQSPGQGQNGCNLAACHNCALLPETSCENKNMLLDRGLMIGTLDDSSVGYFEEFK
jgi:hypothetical protein